MDMWYFLGEMAEQKCKILVSDRKYGCLTCNHIFRISIYPQGRAHQWFLILNLIEQGLDVIKKDPKILVPSYLVQNPLIAGVVKF